MIRSLALIVGAAALAFWAQSAARAGRLDLPVTPASAAPAADLGLGAAPRAAKPASGRAAQFHGLLAASESEVKTRLGAPDVARSEGAGAMWTYRLPDCALFVFFKRPEGQPLKVSGAASGPRVRGRTPPPVNECVAEALQRQAAASTGRATP